MKNGCDGCSCAAAAVTNELSGDETRRCRPLFLSVALVKAPKKPQAWRGLRCLLMQVEIRQSDTQACTQRTLITNPLQMWGNSRRAKFTKRLGPSASLTTVASPPPSQQHINTQLPALQAHSRLCQASSTSCFVRCCCSSCRICLTRSFAASGTCCICSAAANCCFCCCCSTSWLLLLLLLLVLVGVVCVESWFLSGCCSSCCWLAATTSARCCCLRLAANRSSAAAAGW